MKGSVCLIALHLAIAVHLADSNKYHFRIGLVYQENSTASSCNSLYEEDNFWPEDPKVKVLVVPFIIPTMTRITDYRPALQEMRSLNLSGVIHSLDFGLSLLTWQLKIPYFLLSVNRMIVPPHAISVTTAYNQICRAVRSLVNAVASHNSITFLVDKEIPRDAYLMLEYFPGIELLFFPFDITLPPDKMRQALTALTARGPSVTNDIYILLIRDKKIARLTEIMREAFFAGLASNNQLWIIPSQFVSPNLLKPYRFANTRIVTLSSSHSNDTNVDAMIARDCKKAVRSLISSSLSSGSISTSDGRGLTYISELRYLSPSRSFTSNGDSFDIVGGWMWNGSATTSFYISRRISLRKIIVRVAAFTYPPYFLKLNDGSYGGYVVEMFKLIAVMMNVDIRYILVSSNKIGVGSPILSNSTGLIGMLQDGQADIGGIPMLYRKEILKYVDMSSSLHLEGVSLMSFVHEHIDWTFFFKPFTMAVWSVWGITFVILVTSFFIQETISPNSTRKGRRHYTLGDITFLVFTSLIITKLKIIPRMFSTRVFVLLLWFASLIVVASYTANMVPFLIRRDRNIVLNNFQTLYDNRFHRKWFWIKGQGILNKMVERQDPVALKVVQYAQKHWPNEMYEPDVNASIKRLIRNQNDVLIGNSMLSSYLSTDSCHINTGNEVMLMSEIGLVMRKGWPLKAKFSSALNTIAQNKDLQRIYERWKSTTKCVQNLSLKWNDLISIFIFLGFGTAIGIVVAILEYCFRYCRPAVMSCCNIRLRFGKSYEAKVKSVEKTGVLVQIGKGTYQQHHFVSSDNLSPNILNKKPEQLDARKLGIKRKEIIKLRYYGKNPVSGGARLERVIPEDESRDLSPLEKKNK